MVDKKPHLPIGQLSDDSPLNDPAHDRLGRSKFAHSIADAIMRMKTLNGFVLSLQGAWGTGKTTTINFIEHYLNQKPKGERPIIVRFNPWWFSQADDLLLHFLTEFRIAVGSYDQGKGFKQLGKTLNLLGNIVSPFRYLPVPGLSEAIRSGADTLKAGAKATLAAGEKIEKDFQSHRADIDKALRSLGVPILVIVDDLDRLTPEEIHQMFRLVKAVANFPNTIYLLSFDKGIISRSLDRVQGDTGSNFLEKIIQAQFDLPLPNRSALRSVLQERLDRIFKGTPQGLFDRTYWGNLYLGGIEPLIRTMRDVNRLTNALELTYPTVRGAVNFADYVAMESLRIYHGEVYEFIRVNRELITGSNDESRRRTAKGVDLTNDLHTLLTGVLSTMKDVDAQKGVLDMLRRLFPKVDNGYGGPNHDSSWNTTWRKQARVCSPETFDIYFSFSIPEGSVSHAEMMGILGFAISKPAIFKRQIVRLVGNAGRDGNTTKAKEFLENFQDFTEKEIDIGSIPLILMSLYDIADELPEDKAGMMDTDNTMRIMRITYQLLKRIPTQDQRFEILNKISTESSSIYAFTREVIVLGQGQGKHGGSQPATPETEWEISAAQLELLESRCVERIRSAAADGSLAANRYLSWVISSWGGLGYPEEAKQYATKLIKDPKSVAKLLEGFLQRTESITVGDLVSRKRWVVPYPLVEKLVDNPNELKPTVDTLLKTKPRWLSATQKQALESFLLSLKNPKRGLTVGWNSDD